MEKLNPFLIILIGLLLILHLTGVIKLLSGVWGWILAIAVILVGVISLKNN